MIDFFLGAPTDPSAPRFQPQSRSPISWTLNDPHTCLHVYAVVADDVALPAATGSTTATAAAATSAFRALPIPLA